MEDEGIATIEEELDQTEAFDSGSSPETSQIDEVIEGLEDQLETENSTNKTQEPESSGTSEAESLLSKFSGPEWVKPPTGPDNFSTFKLNEKNEWIEVRGVEEINHTQRIKESGDQQRLEEHLGRIEQLLANKALVEIRTSGLDIQTDLVDGVKVNTTEGSVYASLTILNPNGTITFEDRVYKPQEKEEIFTEGQDAPEIVSDDYDEDYSPSFIGSLEALKAQLDLETIPAEANTENLELEASVGEILSDTSGIEIAEAFDDFDETDVTTPVDTLRTLSPKIELLPVTQNILEPELTPAKNNFSEVYTSTNTKNTVEIKQVAEIDQSESIASSEDSEESSVKFQTTKIVDRTVLTEPKKNAIDLFIDQSIFAEETTAEEEYIKPSNFETVTVVKEAQSQILKLKEETKFVVPETSATYAVAETWETATGIEILRSDELEEQTETVIDVNPEPQILDQLFPEQQGNEVEFSGIALTEVQEETTEGQNLESFITAQRFVTTFEVAKPRTKTQTTKPSFIEILKPQTQTIEISGIRIEESVQTQEFSETDETQIIQQAVISEQSTNITILREVIKPQEAISIVDSGEEIFDIALSKMVETSNTSTEVREQITEASAQQEQASGITLEKREETVIQKASTKPVRTTSIRTTATQARRTQSQSSARINSQPAFRTPITPTRTIIEPAQRPQIQQREVQKPQITQRTPTRTSVIPTQATSYVQQVSNSSRPNVQPVSQRIPTSTIITNSGRRSVRTTNTASSVNELNNKVLNFRPTTTTNEEVVTNEETSPFELELAA